MKQGKVFQIEGIMLQGDKKIQSLNVDENKNYKYFGVLEADDVKHSEMKERIQEKYFCRVKTVSTKVPA